MLSRSANRRVRSRKNKVRFQRELSFEPLEDRRLLTINLADADLNYLSEQVNIGNDYAQFLGPLDPNGVREVSGENNNLVGGFDANGDFVPGTNLHGDWGQSDTDFLRIFAPDHPNNGTSYGFTFDPVTMQVIDSGDGTPILGEDGQPLIVPADFATQFAETAIPAPGTSPRTATQLIANSDVDPASPTYNPAAYAAMVQMGGEAVDVSNSVVGTTQTAFIPDPGVLGGVPFNDFFAMFGQFFDHGLDFITKGGGFALTPLSPSDPLYDPGATGPTANMMMLSRGALSNPASDFTINPNGDAVLNVGQLDADGNPIVPKFNNNTGLLIDQSQTYGSHSTINVLVRQYYADGNVTGKLITSAEDGNGSNHDLATFADTKVNAARLGIELIDMDVIDAPVIRADGVGKITFTPQQTVMYRSDQSIAGMGASYAAANDPFVRWTQADADANLCLQSQVGYAKQTGHAIISDMGNAASPVDQMGNPLAPMGTADPTLDPGPGQYNEALLASHYVSGDHRVNENAGLTAIHFIFHEEHNIQADAVMAAVTEQAALLGGQAGADYLAQWQTAPGVWDGEKIYQAARIITETEYNHIAIDQYVGGFVVMPEFVSYSSDINMGISLEFSQAVFRLGHSQNSETMRVAIPDGNGVNPGEPGYVPTFESNDLFDAFLSPSFYQDNGPSGIALGLLNQHANAIDEFVTSALQQTTVGIPLDLAAIDIARARDVGLPTLNEMRQQTFDGLLENTSNNSNGWGIAPYTSWEDFGGHLRHPESLVNFIAAYGREDDVFGLATMRRAYEAGSASGTDSLGAFDATAYDPTPGDVVITLKDLRDNAQVILDAAADQNDPLHADAVLFLRGQGSPVYDPVTGTWNQNDNGGGDLGFWDIDLWIGGLAEQPLFDTPLGTTFSLIMADFGQRMQDADRFYYLYRMPVGHHLGDQIIGEQFSDLIMRTTGLEHIGDAFGLQSAYYTLDGFNNDNPYDGVGAADTYGINDYFNAIYETLPDGGSANDGHIVVVGLEGNDYIVAALGDDYVYGDAGNDVIEGAQGNDHLYGGPGDDWITDYENDDFIHGGPGNDYISAGPGALDTAHGGDGDDEVHGGDGIDEVFGGDGDDMLFGEADTDLMFGGDGNDYMEGGDSVDEMFAGNGNDWMRGGVGDDHLNGGPGNDLMEGGLGPVANDGDRLFGDSPITIGLPVIELNGDGTEGDMDIGSYEDVPIAIFANMQTANANGTSSNLLDTYALIEGLVGSAQNDELTGADANTTTNNGPNNYLIGGGGGDTLTGLGDDYGLDPTTGLPAAGYIDYIFGDSVVVDNDLYWIGDDRHVASGHGNVTGTIENWKGTGDTRVVFQDGTLGHVLGDNGADGVDTAIYRGNRADYNIEHIEVNGHQAIRITDLRDPGDATFDGIDILVGVEFATFADQTISLWAPTNLMASLVAGPQVSLTWMDNATSETGFVVERSDNGGAFTPIATPAASAGTGNVNYVDNTVLPGNTYDYRVYAVSGVIPSGNSNTANVIVPAVPAAPTTWAGTLQAGPQVSLTWMDNATGETGFVIERADNGGAFTQLAMPAANAGTGNVNYVDDTVLPGNTYDYRVCAMNGIIVSGNSNTASVIVPAVPAAPTSLTATVQAGPQVSLNWMDNATSETGFVVERAVNGGAFTQLATPAANAGTGAVNYVDTTVVAGNTYDYRVHAVSGPIASANSNTANVIVPAAPTAPTSLAATLQAGPQVSLTWMDNATSETGFVIERAVNGGAFTQLATPAASAGTGAVNYVDTTVAEGNAYDYRVYAVNGPIASGNSNTVSVNLPAALAAPTNLVATLQAGPQVGLTWMDNATNETGFVVQRAVNGGAFTQLATLGANSGGVWNPGGTGNVNYVDTTVLPGNTYEYRVYAVNGPVMSAYSNTANVIVPAVPAAPTSLVATLQAGPQVNLTWMDNAANETGFVIERSDNGGAFTQLATTAANAGTGNVNYADNAVQAGHTYVYRVYAVNGSLASAVSNTASVSLPDAAAAPTNLVGTLASGPEVQLNFQDNANNETGFVIERADNGGAFTQLATLPANTWWWWSTVSYTDTTVDAGNTYDYRVRSLLGSMVSNPSNTVTVVVPHGPAAPSNFTGTASAWIGPFGRVDLSWTDNSNNETGFVIEVSTSPTFQNATRLTAPANSTTLSQNFLWRGTSYYYRIRAENDYDESAWENLDIFPIVIP